MSWLESCSLNLVRICSVVIECSYSTAATVCNNAVRCDAQETRANELQSKLSQAEMDK